METSSIQNTSTAWHTQVTAVSDSIYQEAGHLVVPESGSAAQNSALRQATHSLIDDAVREAPVSLSCPESETGAIRLDAAFHCPPVLFTARAASPDMFASAIRFQVSSACAPLGTHNFPRPPPSFGAS